jgi:hypothetical protein
MFSHQTLAGEPVPILKATTGYWLNAIGKLILVLDVVTADCFPPWTFQEPGGNVDG